MHHKNTPEYKISICRTRDYSIKAQINTVSLSILSSEANPIQCVIMIDDEEAKSGKDNIVFQYRQNTLGHEFFHCLGSNHPTYKSIKENKAHKSIP